jgi:hypothetical protein
MSGHTATPWEVETPMGDETPWIVEAGLEAYQWRCIAMTCTESSDEGHDAITIEEAVANAAFIVTACNSHAELVKALEECRNRLKMDLDEIKHLRKKHGDFSNMDRGADEADKRAIAQADAALATLTARKVG